MNSYKINDIKNIGKISGIYQIINTVNNKSYIGSSKNISKRLKQHIKKIICKNHHSYKINEDNIDINNLKFIILEEVSIDLLKKREQYWMDKFNVCKNGYNVSEFSNNSNNYKPNIFKTEIKYKNFHIMNMNKRKPEGLSKNDYGNFIQLLNFISHHNTSTYKNGFFLQKEKIKEFLCLKSDRCFRNLLNNLQKHKMIGFIYFNNIKYIAINPVYAKTTPNINYTIFCLFKEDLIPLLDEYTIRLLELEEDDFEINSINPIDKN
jgi:group I intron endonuclease